MDRGWRGRWGHGVPVAEYGSLPRYIAVGVRRRAGAAGEERGDEEGEAGEKAEEHGRRRLAVPGTPGSGVIVQSA
jgi:hypothetical protein